MSLDSSRPAVMVSPEPLFQVRGPWVEILEEAGLRVVYPGSPTFSRGHGTPEHTVDVLRDASAVIAGGEYLTASVIAALPKLRVIARCGVGYDRVDVTAATAANVPVTITPTANHESVAEQTFALLFAIAKSVVINDASTRAGTWVKKAAEPVRGKTLGIFGLGRIGRSTTIRARAMRMNVIATEPHPDIAFVNNHGIELVDFEQLVTRSDYLSIHCPLNTETRGLFNSSVLSRMKQGSVLLNTARGGIVIEADLVNALTHGPLSAAGLDVFEREPIGSDHRLVRLSNVVLSPHIGGVDTQSLRDMAIESAECIVKLSRNEWPTGAVVNDSLRNTWRWSP